MIDRLPSDLISCILSHYHDIWMRISSRRVCSRVRQAAIQASQRHEQVVPLIDVIQRYKQGTNDTQVDHSAFIRSIQHESGWYINNYEVESHIDLILAILSTDSKVKRLSLPGDERLIHSVVRFQNDLTYLSLARDWTGTDNTLTKQLIQQSIVFPRLTGFSVDWCYFQTATLVEFIGRSMPLLQRLQFSSSRTPLMSFNRYLGYLDHSNDPTRLDIDWNALCAQLPHLTQLALSSTWHGFLATIDNFLCTLSEVARLQLEALSIDCLEQLSAETLCHLNELQSLRTLDLSYNGDLDDDDSTSIDLPQQEQNKIHRIIGSLSNHPNLVYLGLYLCDQLILSSQIVESFQTMANLRILSFNVPTDIPMNLNTLDQVHELYILSRAGFPKDLVNRLPKKQLRCLELITQERHLDDTVLPVIGSLLHAVKVCKLFPKLQSISDDKDHLFLF